MITSKITAELFLKDGTKVVLDKTKMKSIQSLSQSTADASTIYYGCLPSTGSLEIIDTNGTIKGYIEDGLIDMSSLEINIYVNDKIIRHHISTNSEYIEEDNSFKINLGDILDLWDEINFTGYYYPEHSETAYDMFYNIFTKYGYSQSDIDTMLSDIIINEKLEKISIKDYLRYINIEYPYLPASTFREMVDKFCTLAQLDCFLNIDGKPKFISSRPITSAYTNPIIIPKKSMYNSFSKSVLLKNKYDDVNLETQIVSDELNIDSSVATNTIKQFNKTMTTCNVNYITVDFYSGSARTEHVVARIEGIYTNGEFSIPKKSNYNLDIIKKTYNYNKNNEQSTWSISYEETSEDDFRFFMSRYFNSFINEENPFSIPIIGSLKNLNGKIDVFSVEQKSENDSSKSAIAELQDNNSITITERENDYLVNYNILTNVKTFSGRGFSQKEGIETGDIFYGSAKEYDALKLDINIHGDKRTISFSSDSVENQSSKNIVTINSNELIQENSTIIFSSNISDIIKSNILLDYSNGISNGNLSSAYVDYYYENGDLAVNALNGDIISVGSVVKVEEDDRLWRVTGVDFSKNGYPQYSELQLMEIKKVNTKIRLSLNLYKCSVVITRVSSENPNATIGEISENTEVYLNDILKFNIVPYESLVDANIQSITINGDNYTNNSEYIVNGNIELNAIVYSWETIVTIINGIYLNLKLESSTGDEQWEHSSNFIPFIIADRDIRISGTSQFTTNSGYNIDVIPQFTDIGNLDWGDQHSLINVTSDDGLVLGSISFSIKKPTKDGEFLYDNHSTLGDNAYMSTLLISKIEQYK